MRKVKSNWGKEPALGIISISIALVLSAISFPGASALGALTAETRHGAESLACYQPTHEEQIVALINQERWRNGGLPPLKANAALSSAAEAHSLDMARNNFYSHTGSDGSSPWYRIRRAGYYPYTCAGETIVGGCPTPSEALGLLMSSSPHRSLILDPEFREVGAGYVYDGDGIGFCHYWTQDFGARSGCYPVVIEREAPIVYSRTVNLYLYGQGWATQMRISNSPDFSAVQWQSFAPNLRWTLTPGSGPKKVYAQLRNGQGSIYETTDEVYLQDPYPVLGLDIPMNLFLCREGDGEVLPDSLPLTIRNLGGDELRWEAQASQWLALSRDSGTAPSTVQLQVKSPEVYSRGIYTATLTVVAGRADNSPQEVVFYLVVGDIHQVYVPLIAKR